MLIFCFSAFTITFTLWPLGALGIYWCFSQPKAPNSSIKRNLFWLIVWINGFYSLLAHKEFRYTTNPPNSAQSARYVRFAYYIFNSGPFFFFTAKKKLKSSHEISWQFQMYFFLGEKTRATAKLHNFVMCKCWILTSLKKFNYGTQMQFCFYNPIKL